MTYLLAFKGLPGTGKTTLTRALAQTLHWPLIDKDDIKDVIYAGCPDSGPLSYQTMFQIARRQLLCGLSVICDSPLMYQRSYQTASAVATETTATLLVIETKLSDWDVWRERIDARKQDASQLAAGHRVIDWATFQAKCPNFRQHHLPAYSIPTAHFTVDTLQPVSAALAAIMSWLAEQGVAVSAALPS